MNVLKDAVKIVNQIRGKENIFGYKSTTANQFYLVYCFLGEIYYSTTFHWHTKLFWFLWQILGVVTDFVQPLSYILAFNDGNRDAATFLYTIFVTIVIIFVCIQIPYTTLIRWRSDVLDAIQTADLIIVKRELDDHKTENELNLGNWIKHIFLYNCFTLSIFCFVCYASVLLFYEDDKVKAPTYYIIHPPKIEQYGSLPFFMIYSSVVNYTIFPVFLCSPTISFVFAICGIIYHNEIQKIINDLNLHSSDLMTIESYQSIRPKYKNAIIKCVKDYQRATKMIEAFRGFYETLAAFILPRILCTEITHAFLFVSPDTLITVRVRELSVFLVSIQLVFMLCWMGDMLDDSVDALRFAVYSTPWYWSTSLCKDVYILLCQTQRPFSARALGVYPLCLATFLRFMNIVQSSVNILRKITSK